MFKRSRHSSPEPEPELLTSKQVLAAVPGLTARKLQWWDEKDVIRHDEMNGHKRIYYRSQLASFALLIELGKRGLSLQKCTRLLRMVFVDLNRGYGYIVTDGKKLKIADTPDNVIDIAVTMRRGVHVVDLADLRGKL